MCVRVCVCVCVSVCVRICAVILRSAYSFKLNALIPLMTSMKKSSHIDDEISSDSVFFFFFWVFHCFHLPRFCLI
ncbi:hypothetical protein GGS21DRAFT_526978, partial [Xylaria nigripes]